jgi:hypothetical protein
VPAPAACLGPSELARCPSGALVAPPRHRCGPCGAVWATRHPGRPPDAAEAAEHRAILDLWRERVGPWCPGDATPGLEPHDPHPSADLTVHHAGLPVAAGGPRATGGADKRVLCRARNAQLGVRLPAELR